MPIKDMTDEHLIKLQRYEVLMENLSFCDPDNL